jgi:hypothetical protein
LGIYVEMALMDLRLNAFFRPKIASFFAVTLSHLFYSAGIPRI